MGKAGAVTAAFFLPGVKMVLVEIVCCTVDDARAAEGGGAGRIELCSALQVGGLTPSLGLLRAVREQTRLPIMAMVRPRPSGFCYAAYDLDVMVRDAALLVENGADGLVFGGLTAAKEIDEAACRLLVSVANGRETVFHRAFDLTPDPFAALETLIACGVTRVLSSGQCATALEGADLLQALRAAGEGRIELLPGGGIRAHNVEEMVVRTGCHAVHLAPLTPRRDPTAADPIRGLDYHSGDGIITAQAVAEVVAWLSSIA